MSLNMLIERLTCSPHCLQILVRAEVRVSGVSPSVFTSASLTIRLEMASSPEEDQLELLGGIFHANGVSKEAGLLVPVLKTLKVFGRVIPQFTWFAGSGKGCINHIRHS